MVVPGCTINSFRHRPGQLAPVSPETINRTLAKTVTYRVLGFLATVPITGWDTALWVHIVLAVIYYIHERAWLRISWGKKK